MEPIAFGSSAWRQLMKQCHAAGVPDLGAFTWQVTITDPGLQQDLARELAAELARKQQGRSS